MTNCEIPAARRQRGFLQKGLERRREVEKRGSTQRKETAHGFRNLSAVTIPPGFERHIKELQTIHKQNGARRERPGLPDLWASGRFSAFLRYFLVFPCNLLEAVLCCLRCCQYPGRRFPSNLFGGDILLLPPIAKRGGVGYGCYMGRNFSILPGHYCCHYLGPPR